MNRMTNAARHELGAATGGRPRRGAQCLVAALAIAVLAGAMPQRALAQEAPPPQPQPQPQPQVIVVPPQQQTQPQPVYVQQVQPGYVVAQPGYAPVAPPPRRRGGGGLGLIISGAVLLGVGWVANFIIALPAGDDPFRSGSEPEWEAFRWSGFIPIAGPWVQLAVKPTSFTEDYWAIWLIIDGLLQATGTALLIAGGAVAAGSGGELADSEGDGIELMVLPNAGPNHAGLSLAGRF